jgi:aspartyl/asparaginyl-tRNA synthetase
MHGLVQRQATEFFSDRRIEALMLPVTTGTISSPVGAGSDSVPVSVKLFGRRIYLADSMQFLLELGVRLRSELEGVWYVMPTFRGEDPDSRHLNEFIHLESEIRGNLQDVIQLVDSLICDLSEVLLTELGDQISGVAGDLGHLETAVQRTHRPQVRYSEAVRALENESGAVERHPLGFAQITELGERKLIEHFGEPVWLTHHPALRAPFYQKHEPQTDTVRCADLLLGTGEVVGAGARQATRSDVLTALERRGIDPDPYRWYIDMRSISPLQTAGFGMGLERFFAWVCGIDDIRHMQLVLRQKDVVPMP